jgi:hypothetical protein
VRPPRCSAQRREDVSARARVTSIITGGLIRLPVTHALAAPDAPQPQSARGETACRNRRTGPAVTTSEVVTTCGYDILSRKCQSHQPGYDSYDSYDTFVSGHRVCACARACVRCVGFYMYMCRNCRNPRIRYKYTYADQWFGVIGTVTTKSACVVTVVTGSISLLINWRVSQARPVRNGILWPEEL